LFNQLRIIQSKGSKDIEQFIMLVLKIQHFIFFLISSLNSSPVVVLVVEGGRGFICVGVAKAVVAATRGIVCGCGGGGRSCVERWRRLRLRGAAVASSVADGSSQAGNRHAGVVPGAPG
jgi:hypothetical protein